MSEPDIAQTNNDSDDEEKKVSSPSVEKSTKPCPRGHDQLFTRDDEDSVVYKITRVMSYHPVKVCGFMFTFILVVVLLTVMFGVADMSDPSDYDWVIADTEESRNVDALDDAVDRVDLLGISVTERSTKTEDKLYFIYESNDGSDIYTASNLYHMCVTESFVVTAPGFSDVCHLVNGNCSAPELSIVSHFYNFTYANEWNCTMLSDEEVNSRKKPIYDALLTPAGQQEYGVWLSKDSVTLGYSTLCNSIWEFGAPLKGYESATDREDDQFEEYQEYLSSLDGSVDGVEAELFEYFDIDSNSGGLFPYYPSPYMAEANAHGINVHWFSVWNLQNEFIRLLASDLNFALFSILFVVFWLRVHTGSMLVALGGIYMIVMSVPFTILIYKKVFNIPFFTELHSLVLFIVLGVGADDVFVLADSWKLTRHNYPEDITNHRNPEVVHRRLLKCYRHTMETVFNTSFTTSMAFLATGLSPLMPIATFGWYAATCITVNYIFVITLMPPVVVMAEMYFENSCLPCQDRKEEMVSGSNEDPVPIGEEDAGVQENRQTYKSVPNESGLELTTSVQDHDNEAVVLGGSDETEPSKENTLVKNESNENGEMTVSATDGHSYLSAKLLGFYINGLEYSVRWNNSEIRFVAIFLILGLFAFGIVGIIYGVQMEPPTTQESWFPDAHMMQQAQFMIMDDFIGVDEAAYAEISVTLGISGIDRSDFNVYIPGKNRGTAKFDDSFNLASPSCQRVMVKMCGDIPLFPCSAGACEPTHLIARADTTRCFMTDFREWALTEYSTDTYTMNETYFYDRLSEFREVNGLYQDEIGFIDGDLKFATVTFTSTMEVEEPMANKMDVQDVVDDLMRHIDQYPECGDCACESLMYTSPYVFTWLRAEMGIVEGFYQGMFVAFPVAFCVLLASTGNYLISFYAILSVLFIVFGVLGFANYALGWELGIAESIAGIIIIGFSVDYTVHLGHMYVDGERQLGLMDRKSKFEHASREIVPTVVGGAITTAGAGAFMFACQLIFFVKMAALIVCTIVLSYIYSLGFFMSILLVMGPEHDQGKVRPIINWFKEKIRGSGEETKVDAEKVTTGGDS